MDAAARFMVCEKSGRWAAGLRWACRANELRLSEIRNLMDCRQELMRSPASFVAIEARKANLEGVLRLLWEIHETQPAALAVVLGCREIAPWHEALQEAGALQVAYSPRRLDIIVRLAERHLSRCPPPPQTQRDAIWSRLPWGESN